MAVALHAEPGHYSRVFSYDTSLVQGDSITVRATNPDDGSVGTREAANKGHFVLWYENGFVGSNDITVTGSDGGEDSGTVDISE